MGKTRMTALDICHMVRSLRSSISHCWVQNIYDLNSKTFQFKLNRANEKRMLIIEAGVRFHLTSFNRPKSNFPSGFSIKLRKHLRGTKLSGVEQVGYDRVIKLKFGKEPNQFFLFVELYSSGNIILTDAENLILAALRYHSSGGAKIAVGEKFQMKVDRKGLPDVTEEHLTTSLNEYIEEASLENEKSTLLQVFSHKSCVYSSFGKDVICHFLKVQELEAKESFAVAKLREIFETNIERIGKALQSARANFELKGNDVKGYLSVSKDNSYLSFECFKFNTHESYISFDTFSDALDEYFSKLESEKIKKKTLNFENQALKKVEKVTKEQNTRLSDLAAGIAENKDIANIILENIEVIDQAMVVIRSCIANQMSWEKIIEVVEQEKNNKNPIASIIRKVKLESNELEVQLKNEQQKMKVFPVDLSLSAYANATMYFSKKKKAASNVAKSKVVADRLIDTAKDKALKQVEINKEKSLRLVANVGVARKTFWFEKFFWFFTKQGFLVLGGRDSSQNEILVKKFMRKSMGDIFIHADLHGASTCVIRNKQKDTKIDPESLKEAGKFAVNRSAAWSAKVPAGSYYVKANQVSKTAPSGEYLTQGSFMVRGKRSYLAPEKLEMGFGYIFKLDETQPSFATRSCDWKPIEYEDSFQEYIGKEVDDGEVVVGNVVLAQTKPKQKISTFVNEVKTENVDSKPVTNLEQLPRGKRNKVKRLMKKYKHKTAEEKDEILHKFMVTDKSRVSSGIEDDLEQKSDEHKEKLPPKTSSPPFSKPVETTTSVAELNLPGFTCKPLTSDELLYAIPMCGPFASLSNFKYKVKLVPGTAKKGKSIRLINTIFSEQKSRSNKEIALIRAIDENHCIQCLPNNIKVSSAAYSRIMKQQKKNKKKK